MTAVTVILAGLVATGLQSARAAGERSREIFAGRKLIAAFTTASADNNGQYLAGYDRTVSAVEWPDGTTAHGPVANRYPFRLGPYYDYSLNGVILVNKNAKQIDQSDTYSLSLSPAFGMNYLYVGGSKSSAGTLEISDEVASSVAHGANLLVFASAGRRVGGSEIVHGFNILTPPKIYSEMWSPSPWKPDSQPESYGNVHARHQGRAVCVFLDGSVQLLSVADLRDMRLWSKNARAAEDPDYTVAAAAPTGGRR